MGHVIFDLDGTLIDSAPSILSCLEFSLSQNLVEPISPLSEDIIGPPLDVTLKKITGIVDEKVVANLVSTFKEGYDNEGYKLALPYDGVNAMLSLLTTVGINIHLATNKRLLPAKKIISFLGWEMYFSLVFANNMPMLAFQNKSEMLEEMLKDSRFRKKDIVYVGDLYVDFEAASSNGIKFAFAEWGYEKKSFKFPISASNVMDLEEKLLKYFYYKSVEGHDVNHSKLFVK